jgi:uroporphyrinogen-III synthase
LAEPPLVLTRPAAQVPAWRDALHALGVPVLAWPLIDIGPAAEPDAEARAWQALPGARLAFFASPNAVAAFMAGRPAGAAWPDPCWAACVGPGSAAALLAAGVPAHRVLAPPDDAAQFDSESLWPQLAVAGPWAGARVLLVRGDGGREWLADRWREAGAQVEPWAVYTRRCPTPSEVERQKLMDWMQARPAPLWLLSSSEAVGHWRQLAGGALPALPVLATHPRIAAAARAAGLQVTEVAPQVAAVAAAWRRHAQAVAGEGAP